MKEPRFERRHMRAIASVLSETARDPEYLADNYKPRVWQDMKTRFGDMLAADNPRFNRGKFEEACEP